MEQTIYQLVRDSQTDYTSGEKTISKYVGFDQYENINKIDAYLNSKHISGDTDSMGREKPFFNIVTAAVNIWYRATDIDRKHIRIKAAKLSQVLASFIATIHLQNWMKKESFGTFLNEWGRTLARFGSAVLKFVEKEGKLIPSVIPWSRLITDVCDFDNNPVIEKLYYTPAQLLQNKNYNQEAVRSLLEAQGSVKEDLQGQPVDNKGDYIEVFEIHGNLPLSYLTGLEKDDDIYRQQMHVVSFVAKKDKDEFNEFTLASGKESQSPYMITHLIKEDGRTQSIGAVEHLFESQWMVNHTSKQIKDQLDLASKLIFQTSDGNFVGRNVLTNIETGDIMIHANNEPLTQISNNSHDITSLQAFSSQWQVLAKEITSTPDSISGNTMPSGTAYRQVAILNQESHSLFEIMTENKGLHIEEMMRKFIIPYIKKQMDSTEEIVATLDSQGITQFDSMYVPNEAIRVDNEQIKQTILSGRRAFNLDLSVLEKDIKSGLGKLGMNRYLKPSEIDTKTWKELLKDFEWECEVEVTNENTDKEVVLTTLSTVLQTIMSNPSILQDPNGKMLFNKILEETGRVSPVELSQVASQPTPATDIANISNQPNQLTK